ncbi:MAG: hypothetical protein V7603_6078 [Micromonosporaceae bacterium]
MPDEPATPRPLPSHGVPAGVGPVAAARWRVDTRLTGMRIAGTLIFAAAAVLLRGDPLGLALCALAAAALLVYTARDVLAPVRLAADAEGVTVVAGFARRVRLRWDQIDRVRVDRRRRLGTVAELLEIDAGDTLHLFSSYDLGVAPHEVEQTLRTVRGATG